MSDYDDAYMYQATPNSYLKQNWCLVEKKMVLIKKCVF